jgi:hypothetical protein
MVGGSGAPGGANNTDLPEIGVGDKRAHMSEANESDGVLSRPAPWGHVGVVLLTEYDHYGRLKKLGTEVRTALDLFAELGFDVTDTDTLLGDGRAFSLLNAIGVWQPSGRRLVVYWAGHGKAIENGRLFLVSRDTANSRQPEVHTAVPAGSIGDLLAGKDANEIVLLPSLLPLWRCSRMSTASLSSVLAGKTGRT